MMYTSFNGPIRHRHPEGIHHMHKPCMQLADGTCDDSSIRKGDKVHLPYSFLMRGALIHTVKLEFKKDYDTRRDDVLEALAQLRVYHMRLQSENGTIVPRSSASADRPDSSDTDDDIAFDPSEGISAHIQNRLDRLVRAHPEIDKYPLLCPAVYDIVTAPSHVCIRCMQEWGICTLESVATATHIKLVGVSPAVGVSFSNCVKEVDIHMYDATAWIFHAVLSDNIQRLRIRHNNRCDVGGAVRHGLDTLLALHVHMYLDTDTTVDMMLQALFPEAHMHRMFPLQDLLLHMNGRHINAPCISSVLYQFPCIRNLTLSGGIVTGWDVWSALIHMEQLEVCILHGIADVKSRPCPGLRDDTFPKLRVLSLLDMPPMCKDRASTIRMLSRLPSLQHLKISLSLVCPLLLLHELPSLVTLVLRGEYDRTDSLLDWRATIRIPSMRTLVCTAWDIEYVTWLRKHRLCECHESLLVINTFSRADDVGARYFKTWTGPNAIECD